MIPVFVLYLLVLIVILAKAVRQSETNADFVLDGKKISGISQAFPERAAGEPAGLLLGLTG